MRIHQLFLFSLAFALRAKSAGHVAEEDFELRQLTDDNVKANTAQGLWCVLWMKRSYSADRQASRALLAEMCVDKAKDGNRAGDDC